MGEGEPQEGYQPSSEEMRSARGIMTDEERELSRGREGYVKFSEQVDKMLEAATEEDKEFFEAGRRIFDELKRSAENGEESILGEYDPKSLEDKFIAQCAIISNAAFTKLGGRFMLDDFVRGLSNNQMGLIFLKPDNPDGVKLQLIKLPK